MRLFGPKVAVNVSTDKNAYLPGETITATVHATTSRELEIEEARAELVFENEYEYREHDFTNRSLTETQRHKDTDRTTRVKQRFLEPGTLPSGAPAEHTVRLTVPDDAAPSGKGDITEVRWKVQAVVSRRHASDPDGHVDIAVLSPPRMYARWAGAAPDLDTHGDCDLELRLPQGPHVRAGDAIRGTLVVTPRDAFELQEVRVELLRKEKVPRNAGNSSEKKGPSVVLAGHEELSTMVPREYPFELAVPANLCPCLETEHSTVRWSIRGVLARRLREDHEIVQPLNLYTGEGEMPEVGPGTGAYDMFKSDPGSAGS
jgi:hypothetical protein